MYFGGNDLTKMDSASLFQIGASQSIKGIDFFGLNMSFSMGPRDSHFDLTRQATNKSQMSVGGFKMRKDLSFNPNGDLIFSQACEGGRQQNDDNIGAELDNVMFANSINVSQRKFDNHLNQNNVNLSTVCASLSDQEKGILTGNNPSSHINNPLDPFGLPCFMTNSQEIDTMGKSALKYQLGMNKSIANKRLFGYDDILLGDSNSIGRCASNNNNIISVNLSALAADQQIMRQSSAFKQYPNFSISLMDQKLEIKSEPDYDVSHMNEFINMADARQKQGKNQQGQWQQQEQQDSLDKNIYSIPTQKNQENTNQQSSFTGIQMTESSTNVGMTIEPFQFTQAQEQYELHYPHSDDEQNDKHKKTIKIPQSPIENTSRGGNNKNPQKASNYRQSRHKNVFKNFGGTLVRFIIYNQYFQDRVIQELNKDAVKKQAFQEWLQNDIKLERKKDFQIAWTTFKTDKEEIKEFKGLLRELSRDFFENFSFIYLINSKKISDLEIHLRSIHTYLASISNPEALNRFKPV